MHVLVVATPMPGHLLPLVPLTRALRDAGHQVNVATTGDALRSCAADLPVVDVAPDLRLIRLMLRFAFAHPRMARDLNAGRDDRAAIGRLWAPVGERMVAGVAELADRVIPDLVVHEPFAVAAAEVAARRGLPAVVVEHSLFEAAPHVSAVAAAYRGGAELPESAECITTAPPSVVGARPGRSMRFIPPGTGESAPDGLDRPSDRPRLLVSRSTVVQPGRDRLMSTVVAAAADTDLEVVLVRPDRWVTRRPLPPNVRTTEWLPFPAVLPTAAGIVHHGGAGTVLTALAAGTPQLVVRGAGDRRANAELVAGRGAGVAVDLEEITPAVLQRLVSEPAISASAREVAAEIVAMPHPTELVAPLTELARDR